MSRTPRPAPIRLNPDTRGVVIITTALVGTLAVTSFIASASALVAVAAWAALPPALGWTIPVTIDGGILAYTAVALVHRHRGEGVFRAWGAVGAFTAISAGANAAYALALGGDRPQWQVLVGAGIAALMPVAVMAATHALAGIAVAPAPAAPRRTAATKLASTSSTPPGPEPALAAVLTPRAETSNAAGDREALQDQARRLAVDGQPQRAIAEELGVGKSTIARWLAEDRVVA